MSKPNKEVKYRTLFIGLGGTGGRVLLNLNNLLDEKQKYFTAKWKKLHPELLKYIKEL